MNSAIENTWMMGTGLQVWFVVRGIRHAALVKAASPDEAIRKAIEHEALEDWELYFGPPSAEQIGAELPEVFPLK